MAKVQYGALVTALSGSIGGWTFQKNRAGNIVRTRGATHKSSTPKQSLAHQDHIRYLHLWQDLSIANKLLWNTYADTWTRDDRFGTTKTLTGQNWFESTNYNRELLSLSVLNSPPAHILPVAMQDYTITLTDTKIEITFSPAFNPANNGLIIRTTSPISLITTSFRQYTRLTDVKVSGPWATLDITAFWEAAHNIPYTPSIQYWGFGIGFVLQTVNLSSGIASTGLFKSEFTVKKLLGIGWMIIESTFIVS